MAKINFKTYCGSSTNDNSRIGFDYDYQPSTMRSYPTDQSIIIPFPIPGTIGRKRFDLTPLITFPSDGIIQRTRPSTMRNSENSDYIICQTSRGPYIAYRTPIVPAWITRLVHEIELREK